MPLVGVEPGRGLLGQRCQMRMADQGVRPLDCPGWKRPAPIVHDWTGSYCRRVALAWL